MKQCKCRTNLPDGSCGCISKRSNRVNIIKGDTLKHEKEWGYELWIHNDEDYCGKILHFNGDARFSMHFHLLKKETWYVSKGSFTLRLIDTEIAQEYEYDLKQGDIIEIERGQPHQLIALEEGDIFEISTQHFNNDSYRIYKGDSQK